MAITLFHYRYSSSSWRVRWALALKKIAHDAVEIDLTTGAQNADEYRARSPLGTVPALTIDGRTLAESVAILEYLDERFPDPPLYPRDPWLRARTRQLVEIINADTQPLQNLSVLRYVSDDHARRKEWGKHFTTRGLAAYDALLARLADEGGSGRFSVGDSVTAADLYLLPMMVNARRYDIALAEWPRLVAIEAAAMATPEAQETRPG